MEFGVGNGSGGLELRRGTTTWTLYTGANLHLNGRPLACDHPPRRGEPKSMFCPDWSASVVLGSTRVAATYWLRARGGNAPAANTGVARPRAPERGPDFGR